MCVIDDALLRRQCLFIIFYVGWGLALTACSPVWHFRRFHDLNTEFKNAPGGVALRQAGGNKASGQVHKSTTERDLRAPLHNCCSVTWRRPQGTAPFVVSRIRYCTHDTKSVSDRRRLLARGIVDWRQFESGVAHIRSATSLQPWSVRPGGPWLHVGPSRYRKHVGHGG